MPDSPVFNPPGVVPWPQPGLPANIEYSPDAFDRLRLAALDGLMALPRVGMGTGGLLLGVRTGDCSRILDFLPVACSHADGPSFRLSAAEMEEVVQQARSLSAVTVLGCYCSKTRGKSGVSEDDRAFFNALCPEPWQVLIVIRPSLSEASRAGLFFRRKGEVEAGTEIEIRPTVELRIEPEAAVDEGAAMDERAAVVPVAVVAADVVPPEIVEARPEPPPKLPKRLFAAEPELMPEPPSGRRWLPGVIAVLVLIVALSSIAWLTRDLWYPRPPLRLEVTEAARHVTFHWSPDAVRGISSAALMVNDGGELRAIPLDGTALARGAFGIDRKSAHVTGTLRVGEERAIASYFEPAPADPPKTAPPPNPVQ